MARAGDTLQRPDGRGRVIFRRTGAETNDEVLEAEVFVEPGDDGPPEHVHPNQEERFVVLSGAFTIEIRGEEKRFNSGEECVVTPGTAHRWWNADQQEAHVRLEFRPAGRIDLFLEAILRDGQ